MNPLENRLPMEKSMAFFGAITASLSHEINNALAIINELAGLIADFVSLAEQGHPLDSDRLKNVTSRIAGRVEDGKGFVTQLNRFAHSTDHPRIKLDARDAVEQIVGLCQRFARLRKLSLTHCAADQPLMVEGNPFELLHAIYRCIEIALDLSPQGSQLVVTLAPGAAGARIAVSGPAPGEKGQALSDQLAFLRRLGGELGGELTTTIEAGQDLQLTLELPSSLRSVAYRENNLG